MNKVPENQNPQLPANGQPAVPWGPNGDWQPATPPVPQGHYQPPAPPKQKIWFARHKALTGLMALVLVGGIASAAGSGGKGDTPASGSTSSAAASSDPSEGAGQAAAAAPAGASQSAAPKKEADKPKKEADKPKTTGLNTPVRDGKFEFTVTKVVTGKKTVGSQYLQEKAQGQFVLVTVKVANIGDETRALSDSDQKMFDDKRRSFEANSMAGMSLDNNQVFYENINPGNSVTGVLVYDMPVGAVPTKMELHDSMFSGGVTIGLK